MPECDYCEADFEDEDAYLEHLAAEHQGELSRIDQRRVEDHASDSGGSRTTIVAGVLGVIVVAALVGAFFVGGGSGGPSDGEAAFRAIDEGKSLPDSGNQSLLQDVERFPSQGNGHVSPDQISYDRIPPLSGPHLGQSLGEGFYERSPQLGLVVHTLEHGGVVIYYDPDALTKQARQSLQEFVNKQSGDWRPVAVLPNPNDDPKANYVVTAWRTRMYMDTYNPAKVYAFIAEYLGRGPENPIR